jgi:hypothetical protein
MFVCATEMQGNRIFCIWSWKLLNNEIEVKNSWTFLHIMRLLLIGCSRKKQTEDEFLLEIRERTRELEESLSVCVQCRTHRRLWWYALALEFFNSIFRTFIFPNHSQLILQTSCARVLVKLVFRKCVSSFIRVSKS